MATSSTTTIHDMGEPVTTIYRQYDGGPADHGAKLLDFLKGAERSDIEGLSDGQWLAAEVVNHIMRQTMEPGMLAGTVKILPPSRDRGMADYHYDVFAPYSGARVVVVTIYNGLMQLWSGPVTEWEGL